MAAILFCQFAYRILAVEQPFCQVDNLHGHLEEKPWLLDCAAPNTIYTSQDYWNSRYFARSSCKYDFNVSHNSTSRSHDPVTHIWTWEMGHDTLVAITDIIIMAPYLPLHVIWKSGWKMKSTGAWATWFQGSNCWLFHPKPLSTKQWQFIIDTVEENMHVKSCSNSLS